MGSKEKVYIAGHTGLIGKSVHASFKNSGFEVCVKTSAELDLRNTEHVQKYLGDEMPTGIIFCAARVGGIGENVANPLEMITENIEMQYSVLKTARNLKIKKLIFISSAAVYPARNAVNKEVDLLTGSPSPEHIQYALAKISGMEYVKWIRENDHFDWISVIPNNIYGENDRWDENRSHVIASLIMKIVKAKESGESKIPVWGSGKAKREFMHADDAGNAILEIYNSLENAKYDRYNLGSQQEFSIEQLASILGEICEYKGSFVFDKSMPEGPTRRMLDNQRFREFINWETSVSFRDGLVRSVNKYMELRSTSKA